MCDVQALHKIENTVIRIETKVEHIDETLKEHLKESEPDHELVQAHEHTLAAFKRVWWAIIPLFIGVLFNAFMNLFELGHMN